MTLPDAQPARPTRQRRPPIDLRVMRRRSITPHLVRVTLGGAGFSEFEDRDETDKYVKLIFTAPEGHQVTRTYTIRSVDHGAQTIDIDFVVHGDDGIAAPWAARSQPGEAVSLSGPGGGYTPDPTADWHLLVGDASALPAIAAAIDALPAAARGIAYIEVESEGDVVALPAPAAVAVHWIVQEAPDETALATAVRSGDWPDGRVDVFAHGERGAMKELRRVLFEEHGLDRGQVSLSGYWARGRTEDRFQAEKREPIGQILLEG
ncbi:MAG: siderophore-interacting protein [Leifsonia sp.]